MKLLFKQRFFSWLDSYDIYGEDGKVVYTVEGKLSFGHCLHVLDAHGQHVATLQEKIFRFLPKFEISMENQVVGTISKEFSLFIPRFNIDYLGWHIEGNMMEWDYDVFDERKEIIATVSKEVFHWMDTYVIDVVDPSDALSALMLVLAIDAEKCSRD